MRLPHALTFVAIGAALLACSETDEVSGDTASIVAAPAPDELLLDARADGAALFGRVLPFPAGADPDRALALRMDPPDLAPELVGATVLDARFVEGGVVVLHTSHELALYRRADAAGAILDTEVEGPLSVRGHDIAYVRGAWPELEVARADARTGEARAVTDGLAPAWNPALAEDGSIVFVSGATGGPKLLRAEPGGAVREIPATRFPASATAPRIVDGTLIFEDETGAAWLDLASGRVERAADGLRGLTFLPDGSVRDGRLEAIEIGAPRSEVTR